ncbi:hypothetical protein [Flavobacterium humidisoli]|uniref:Uncharacterized protein n=1 Tax=Flavobacterium humidisoli TaxID=2937442 RepID=A0ABY4LXX7_9FLAO|nr:hypothetical protein [Flavobacterium humidisoli]UPZ17944.1 hypothetical protein M0M44_11485 [Flavobacterium humidisoli]
MKNIPIKHLFTFLFVLSVAYSFAQTVKPAPKKIILRDTLKDPLNKTAFHKNIMQDLNFMVLGDNNTKQGFAYEYDEKKTELSLSGARLRNRYIIATVDRSFSVDDGVFIFANRDGSKKGSINLNLFASAPFGNGKFYPAAKDDKVREKAHRARYLNYIAQKGIA